MRGQHDQVLTYYNKALMYRYRLDIFWLTKYFYHKNIYPQHGQGHLAHPGAAGGLLPVAGGAQPRRQGPQHSARVRRSGWL